jgi:hypothetical protein
MGEPYEPNEQHGGTGGVAVYTTRADMRMVAKAIRERWPVTEEVRKRCVDDAVAILDDAQANHRTRIAALRLLLAADAVNVSRERNEVSATTGEQSAAAAVLRAALATNAAQLADTSKLVAIASRTAE